MSDVTIPDGWSTDFDEAPADTPLWVYATCDDGYGYGVAYKWRAGNPGQEKLVWSRDDLGTAHEVNDGVERALMWHRVPAYPGGEVLDAVAQAIRSSHEYGVAVLRVAVCGRDGIRERGRCRLQRQEGQPRHSADRRRNRGGPE
jgi:hypothetical protein